MPVIFLANTTKQVREFYYRPFTSNPLANPQPHKRVTISPGGQAYIPGEYPLAWVNKLIEGERKYGWLPVGEFSRNRDFVGIIWSLDKPVNEGLISAAIEKNDDVKDAEALQEQRRVALAASGMSETLPTTNAPRPMEFDMSLEEKGLRGTEREENTDANAMIEVRLGRTNTIGKNKGGRPRKAA